MDLNSSNPTPPYADWSTAAAAIQDAVDAASAGDTIWVTNGLYQTGGKPAPGEILTNRVVATNAITLQSVNGPEVTVIAGYQVPTNILSDASVRCAHLADGCTLNGFTLANGATLQLTTTNLDAQGCGGGVWCQSTNVTVSNCVVVSNCCSFYGGGIYSGAVSGCQIQNNGTVSGSLGGGGGAACSLVSDSTIRSNYAIGGPTFAAGGAWACVARNTIIEGNLQAGAYYSLLYGCSILNNSNTNPGGGAIQCLLSNCTVAGNFTARWGGGVYNCTLYNSVVCSNRAAYWGGGVAYDQHTNTMGRNNLVYGNVAQNVGGGIYLSGNFVPEPWDLLNWTVVSNSTALDGGGLYVELDVGGPVQVDGTVFAGNFAGRNGGGVSSQIAQYPLTNCTLNANVALGNGGGAYNAALVNCLVGSNRAVNGGGLYGGATNCVFTGNVASGNGGGFFPIRVTSPVLGCSFTNNSAANGGGAYSGTFANCSLCGNSALTNGGALYGGAFSNCLVMSNTAAFGGGVFAASGTPAYPPGLFNYLNSQIIGNFARADAGGFYFPGSWSASNCLVQSNTALNNGGGTLGGTLSRCTLIGNRAAANGGGAYNPILSFSAVSNNVAAGNGGGICGGSVSSCLVTCNSAANGGGTYGSGVYLSTLVHNQASGIAGGTYATGGTTISGCIIYDNSASSAPNNGPSGAGFYAYCCTTPAPLSGQGILTSDPAFVDLAGGNYRLQTNSPCINTGNTTGATGTDLDGRPRVVGGKIDIGAYEFQGPGMGEFTAWLQQHGLSTSGSDDYTDSDHDGLNNWQEWQAGTDPTNAASVLSMLTPALAVDGAGTLLSWQSVSNRSYFLQRSTNLLAPTAFSTLQSNISGQFGTTSYTDTNAPVTGPVLYRVGVQ